MKKHTLSGDTLVIAVHNAGGQKEKNSDSNSSREEMGTSGKRRHPLRVEIYDEDFETFCLRMTVAKPTAASARRSKLWSRERQTWEDDFRRSTEFLSSRPYLRYEYPELKKHYPGTRRVATPEEMTGIVERLTKPCPTARSIVRSQSAPVVSRRSRLLQREQMHA
ncbi:hypothetical protein LOTGIDRAFT_228570 [Lottia gigantea]|uniref:Uncharacterized protein n=1 Tax=Lottia gigantea TaxID=225164 RepID=V4AJQ0_LOTGI|nr:hypothetical protein LOTGIDRAFT_228570 [Lottia gigantea]ESO93801.1 hypothetical protein LOTGIDRAFT_228570 [Lottia gigantea]